MSLKKWSVVLGVLVVVSMILTACPAPQAQVVEKVVTQVVEKEVKVVETKVVETVKEVVKEVQVVATPVPVAAEKKLRINLGSYPDIIDPQKSSFVNEIAHLKLMYEGLTKLDKDLKTVPGAAEKWEYNADATELTFTLQPDLKYSDGSVLNAARFAYSIKRNINPETAGEYAQITDEIKGAPEWRGFADDAAKSAEENAKAKADAEAVVTASIMPLHADGAACAADKTVRGCRLHRPQADVVQAGPVLPHRHDPVGHLPGQGREHRGHRAVVEQLEVPDRQRPVHPEEPRALREGAVFAPNPNYWADKAKMDIEYSYITDSKVAFEAYKNNEFDIVGAAAEDLEVIKQDATLSKELMIYPGSCTFAIMFHQLKEPFTDPKVRQAFAQAYDRETWVKDVLKGLGSPTLTWIPPGFPGYDADRETLGLRSGGGQEGVGRVHVRQRGQAPAHQADLLRHPAQPHPQRVAGAKWKEVLGVDMKLDPVEPTTYTALTKDIKTAPLAFILGWCADYPDPQNWLSVYWKTGAFGERIGYSNKDFDKLVDQADVELDPAKRMELYAQAQKLLTDGVPVAFAWNNVNNYLVKPWVKGIETTPQDSDFPGSTGGVTSIDIDTTLLPK